MVAKSSGRRSNSVQTNSPGYLPGFFWLLFVGIGVMTVMVAVFGDHDEGHNDSDDENDHDDGDDDGNDETTIVTMTMMTIDNDDD